MFSKRELEGYLLIDHRDSPGISAELAAQTGMNPVPAGMKFESATVNCHVCQVLVVLNPKRTRSRGYCPRHDRYTCDTCEAVRVRTGVCKSFNEIIDEIVDKKAKGA